MTYQKSQRQRQSVCHYQMSEKILNSEPVYSVWYFMSDHLVNIKDMFLESNDNIEIVYEQMNILLRYSMTVTEGLLQAFDTSEAGPLMLTCECRNPCINKVLEYWLDLQAVLSLLLHHFWSFFNLFCTLIMFTLLSWWYYTWLEILLVKLTVVQLILDYQ